MQIISYTCQHSYPPSLCASSQVLNYIKGKQKVLPWVEFKKSPPHNNCVREQIVIGPIGPRRLNVPVTCSLCPFCQTLGTSSASSQFVPLECHSYALCRCRKCIEICAKRKIGNPTSQKTST